MTPLERALREKIRSEGPMTVEAYMEACNAFYYSTRDPLGADGDFTTAPEISQMFGELIGACLADCWAKAGKPENIRFVELGPGRGTLAADALRVMRSAGLDPPVHFIESSPVLRSAQAEAVEGAIWHESIDEVPDGPLLIVANEFFDAIPVRQYVHGTERKVVIAGGGLAFDRDGEIVETSPARTEIARTIARRLAKSGGAALIIDYGHERSASGDTLQAVRRHRFAPLLDRPGEQDLTAHVDFEALSEAARSEGASVTSLVAQGRWLERLGIGARAEALAKTHPNTAGEIDSARRRLCDPVQMGEVFKVIAIHSPGWAAPAGFQ